MMHAFFKHRWSFLPLVISACLVCGTARSADPQPVEKKGNSSLDEQLLKGLGGLDEDPLTKDLAPSKSTSRGEKEPSSKRGENMPAAGEKQGKENPLDKQLLEGLTEGEDLGEPGESGDPLVRLGQQMRQAGGLIGQTKSGEPTQQLQKKIVNDLEALIKMARQQQQQQQSSSSSKQQTARREQVKQSKPGGSPGQQDEQDKPAQDSTERLGKNEVRRPDMAQMNDMIKRVWGQLPEKEREQMLQNSVDQFLPKYELEIEAYFKSLVERQRPGEPK